VFILTDKGKVEGNERGKSGLSGNYGKTAFRLIETYIVDILRLIIKNVSERLFRNIQSPVPVTDLTVVYLRRV
jgi:hypothetical protein